MISFATTYDGQIFAANGMDPVLFWDGLSSQMYTVGLAAASTAVTIAGSGSGSLSGTYTAYLLFVDAAGNVSNLSPISNILAVAGSASIQYTGVTIPDDPKVVQRILVRNTSGQARTYYEDVVTDDLTQTTFYSTKTDVELLARLAHPVLDSNNNVLANLHGTPPTHKPILCNHQGYMFLAGQVAYTQGSAQVTLGSKTVTGIGTEWTASLAGRLFATISGSQTYEIDTVDTTAQTITLTEAWQDATDLFAPYSINPFPGERKLVYFSLAGLPHSWPATNAVGIEENGDEIVGLMSKSSFLYILERRHIHRLTFQADPGVDGFVFLAANRGCVNNRCWVNVYDQTYMLDEAGIHSFSGGQDVEPLSLPIQDIFRPSDSPYRINWQASKWFHAAAFPSQETIRFFVALDGSFLPRHAIAYSYAHKRWWIEEYPVPIGASCTMTLDMPRTIVGSEARTFFGMWQGTLDKVDPSAGTVRGDVSSATIMTLVDSTATFPATGVVGSPVSIVSGRGKGQRRLVSSVSGTTLNVSQPWLIVPDSTSTYQIGGVEWTWQSGWMRWQPSEIDSTRRVEVIYQPLTHDATFDMQIYMDWSTTPIDWDTTIASDDGGGLAAVTGEPFLTADLTKESGIVQARMDGHRELMTDGGRWMSVGLSGVSNQEMVQIFGLTIEGAVENG